MAICLSRTSCCADARRMTRNPFPLPRELGAQFTTKAAGHLGVSGSRLRQADLEHPFYGTYRRLRYDGGSTSASLQSRHELWKQRQLELAATLMQRLPPDTLFGGRTAAAIWDLPMPHVPDDTLELVRLSPGRSLRLDRVRCTRIEAKYVRTTQHRGFPVTDAASTWCMLAPRLPWKDGIALGDGVIHRPRVPGTRRLRHRPYSTIEQLERLATMPRRRGGALLAEMTARLSTQSASAPESHLRLALAEWQLPDPRLDYDVRDSNGRLLGCSEIAWPELRLVQEYEGDHHRTNVAQWNRDLQKYSDYRKAGWEIMRVTADLLYRRPGQLRRDTVELLGRQGWSPGR